MRGELEPDAFPYSLRISRQQRYNLIRFPSDDQIYARLLTDASTRLSSGEAFHSITKTRWEISVIQDARYPLYPDSLNEYLDRVDDLVEKEKGFALIEVMPSEGSQIDFGTSVGIAS
jgi:hypothetical protein